MTANASPVQTTPAPMSEMQRVLNRLPKRARKWVQDQLDANVDLAFKNEPYYSTVRFEPDSLTADGSNNTTTVFNAGHQVQAFTYGQGGAMGIAGYNAAGTGYTIGQQADTNLIVTTGKVTNGNDLVVLDGLAIIPTPKSDPRLTQWVMRELYISAGFGGNTNDFKFGQPLLWPGSAGLFGSTSSILKTANLQDATGIIPGYLSNGLPGAADVRWFSDPIVWYPQSSNLGDTQFAMFLTIQRLVSVFAAARIAVAGAGATQAVTPPVTQGAEGTFVEFLVYMPSVQFGPRSQNR
jgi:hypothetical protein